MITLRYCRATVVTYFTQVAVSEIDFTNARQSVHFKGHPVALPAPALTFT